MQAPERKSIVLGAAVVLPVIAVIAGILFAAFPGAPTGNSDPVRIGISTPSPDELGGTEATPTASPDALAEENRPPVTEQGVGGFVPDPPPATTRSSGSSGSVSGSSGTSQTRPTTRVRPPATRRPAPPPAVDYDDDDYEPDDDDDDDDYEPDDDD